MTESERIQIIQLSRQGLNDNQIAKMMHYSRPHISETMRGMGMIRKRGRICTIPNEKIALMCEMRREGKSYQQIAKHLKMNRYTVYDCIKRQEKA